MIEEQWSGDQGKEAGYSGTSENPGMVARDWRVWEDLMYKVQYKGQCTMYRCTKCSIHCSILAAERQHTVRGTAACSVVEQRQNRGVGKLVK